MQLETIRFDRMDAVGVIRLHRPERMNAVVEAMYRDLGAVLEAVRADPGVRALVLTGTVWKRAQGEKQAFCAGADLKRHAARDRGPEQRRAYIRLAHDTARAIHDFEKPIVAAVNGPARGAGAELALACDLVLMADTATLAFPETGLGTCVGGGVTQHLVRIAGMMRAKHLLYTGRVVNGGEAVELGLALRSVPVERLLPEAVALARELAERAPISMARVKQLLHRAPGQDLPAVLGDEAEAILACMETRDWQEGVAAFAEKRKPQFAGR